MAVNDTYYIIQRTNEDQSIDYLNSIYQQSLGFMGDYAQAIRFEDTPTASAFVDFCEANSAFDVEGMEVTLSIQPITGA